MTLREKAEVAQKAARKAANMLSHHGALHVRMKSENDFVTECDLLSENMIREALLTACPEDVFYGEESGGDLGAGGVWIVDPIDGTANFMRGQKLYAISIAYQLDGELVVGVVYCPGTDEMFVGVRGEGAYVNGEPIHVSDIDDMKRAIVHIGFGHRHPEYLAETEQVLFPLMRSISDLRRSGVAAYDICCIAAGRAEAFIEQGLGIYDYAAGAVILKEAGGSIDGWHPWQEPISTGCLIAGNGRLNKSIQDLLNP